MNYDCSKCPVTLETFCEKDRSRFELEIPFRIGDWVYATDGRIAVRVWGPTYHGTVNDGGRFPAVEDLEWDATVLEWGPVPSPEPCEACHELRVRPYHYEYVDEEGYRSSESDLNVLEPCKHCVVHIGGRTLRWWLVEPLTRFARDLQCGVSDDDADHPVHFRSSEMQALVMPLQQDDES